MRSMIATTICLLSSMQAALADDLLAFKACIGPELEPRARLIGYAAPCMVTGDCRIDPDERPDFWFGAVETECAATQVDTCAISPDPASCFKDYSSMLKDLRAGVLDRLPAERIDAAIAQGGLRAGSLERNRERMFAPSEGTEQPSEIAVVEERLGLATDTLMVVYEDISAWLGARMYERMVETVEAGGR
ncbi:MAG: hypothetical protein AAGE03_03070 [Pseudomonadota bacterium]